MPNKLSSLLTPEMVAHMGGQQSGMGNAAAMVGAGSPDPRREALARQVAAQGAQRSGMGNAASMVGAAPSRGQLIRARLSELRAGGLSGIDAMRQAAAEGLIPKHVARVMTGAPSEVTK